MEHSMREKELITIMLSHVLHFIVIAGDSLLDSKVVL